MSDAVSQMSKDELKEMIETAVETKLMELLGDPDAGRTIKKRVRDQLQRQRKAIVRGERGDDFDAVTKRLGLD